MLIIKEFRKSFKKKIKDITSTAGRKKYTKY